VNQIQEVYADFSVINDDFFTLNIPSVIGLTEPITKWSINDQQSFNRMTDAIFSILMSTRTKPLIRYQKSSDLCYRLAEKVQGKLNDDDEFVTKMSKNSPSTVLLIMDRREDPVTPLLNQWTYQAMIHEILEINNNRVDLQSRV